MFNSINKTKLLPSGTVFAKSHRQLSAECDSCFCDIVTE